MPAVNRIAVFGDAAAFNMLKSTLLYNKIRDRVDISARRTGKMDETVARIAEVVGRLAAGTHITVETQHRVRWMSCKGRTIRIQGEPTNKRK